MPTNSTQQQREDALARAGRLQAYDDAKQRGDQRELNRLLTMLRADERTEALGSALPAGLTEFEIAEVVRVDIDKEHAEVLRLLRGE